MIKYWPYMQGIELNNEVAYLFSNTRQKFSHYLFINTTNYLLPIDIIDNDTKRLLFSSVLHEIEILILDIVELDLNLDNIKLLNYKILCDLIEKSLIHFICSTKITHHIKSTLQKSHFIKLYLCEHKLLLENILAYIIFGSHSINATLFAFKNTQTPYKHVSILLDNLIIQISNLTICTLLDNIKSLPEIVNLLITNKLCHSAYISIRSIALFRNNLIIQSLIHRYIYQPKAIYGSRYKVWLLSTNGFICKYIHTSRLEELPKLSRFKLIFILFIEIQDLIIPHFEQFILMLGKIILYILINIIGSCIIFIIRTISSSLNQSK